MSGRAERRADGTVWLFDLDNTLHNASVSAFGMLDHAMNAYIERELQVTAQEADRLRRHYWLRYGATVLGLQRHHGVNPMHFLHEAHILPGLEDRVRSHAHDCAALKRLPGRKIVLTNAPSGYTQRVLACLGIARHFDSVIAVDRMRVCGQLRPKPDGRLFRHLMARLKVRPSRCVLVEDTLAHQKVARGLGLRTVWMQRWLKQNSHGPEVGVYLHRKPSYVCARIRSLQQLHREL